MTTSVTKALLCITLMAAGTSWMCAQQSAPPAAAAADAQPHGFPPVRKDSFTAAKPSKETVEAFMHAQFGFDSNRIWQVQAIVPTIAPDYNAVTVLLASRTSPDHIQPLNFVVTPDQKFAIIGAQVIPFGAEPFAMPFAELKAHAEGPATGAAGKDLMFVEFSDFECPHCKTEQPLMEKLAAAYPGARVVYQSFPLASIHPWAVKAARYGVCVNEQGTDKYLKFVDAVYAAQDQTTEANADDMMKSAATKAGADAAKAAACSALPATAAKVDASIALGQRLGVDSTPTLFINGRPLAISPELPLEVLQGIITFQAEQDHVTLPPSAQPLVAPPTK